MDNLDEKGMAARREVLGAEYVDASVNNADDFMMAFQELTTNHCWGAIFYCTDASKFCWKTVNIRSAEALETRL